ncbi:MAG: ATP-binding protein [Planctomycetota bacterium]
MKREPLDLGLIFESLNLVAWESDSAGLLHLHGPVSAPLREQFPVLDSDPLQLQGQFRFLTHFIDTANDQTDGVWAQSKESGISSGTWEEDDGAGGLAPFCAHAFVSQGRKFLVLEKLGTAYQDQKSVLQVARVGSLAYEELQRAQEALQQSQQRQESLLAELDERVQARTTELHQANEQLRQEINGHLQTQQALLDHQEELRTLAERLVLAEEQERRRIAVGLHDDLGQALAMANIKMGQLASAQPELVEEIGEVRLLLKKAITRTRTLTFELSSPILHELGLDAALENLVQQFGARAEIQTRYESEAPQQVPEKTAVLIYQAVRELLHNVQKHAAADKVVVTCEWQPQSVQVTVADDGRGLSTDPAGVRDSFGLFNVQQRIDHLGGSFLLQSAPDRGTKITLRVPFAEATDGEGGA